MTDRLDPEGIDLARLTRQLQDALVPPLEGDVEGRTRLRDAAVSILDCSQLEAEQVIDTMVSLGFLRTEHTEAGQTVWRPKVR